MRGALKSRAGISSERFHGSGWDRTSFSYWALSVFSSFWHVGSGVHLLKNEIIKKAGLFNPAFFAFWHAGEMGLKLLDSSLMNVIIWYKDTRYYSTDKH